MNTNSGPVVAPINWGRVAWSGLAAGLIVNAFEYGGHRIYLDDAWTAAFRALGKTPTGWSTFIPANFFIGILLVWLYARLRPRYGRGPKTALRSGLATWVVFWVIPLMALCRWIYSHQPAGSGHSAGRCGRGSGGAAGGVALLGAVLALDLVELPRHNRELAGTLI